MWASWPATVSRCRVGARISFKAAQSPGSFIAAAIRFSMSLFGAQANQMTPRMLAHARAINEATALALYNAMTSSGSRRSLFEQASLLLRAIACPLEHFDAIGFAARRVEDFAVAYALESGAHQADSLYVAGRI
jgi:hypothetical protein